MESRHVPSRKIVLVLGLLLGAGATLMSGTSPSTPRLSSDVSAFPMLGGLGLVFIDNGAGKMHMYTGVTHDPTAGWIRVATYDLDDVGKDNLIAIWERPPEDPKD